MIKDTLKNKENLFLILLNLAVFIFFMVWLGSRYITLDDSTYLNLATSDEFTMQRMAVRFNTWSQRFLIDYFVLYVLSIESVYLPKILTFLCIALFYYALTKIIGRFIQMSLREYLLVACLCFFQSQYELEGAGYFTTYINFYLPMAAGLYAVNLLFDRIGAYKTVILYILVFFAVNNEMAAGAMALLLVFVYFKVPKYDCSYIEKIPLENRSHTVICFILSLIGLLMFFKSGAVTFRMCTHMTWIYPGFEDINILTKIYHGSLTTLCYYFADFNPFSIFFVTVLIQAYAKSQNIKLTAVKLAVIVFCMTVVFYLLSDVVSEVTATKTRYIYAQTIPFSSGRYMFTYLFTLAVCGAVIYMIMGLKRIDRRGVDVSTGVRVNILVLLAIGFAVRMIMAFSPTLVFSQARTFVISNCFMLLAGLYIVKEYLLFSRKSFSFLVGFCTILCLFSRVSFMTSDEFENFPYYPSPTWKFDRIQARCVFRTDIKEAENVDEKTVALIRSEKTPEQIELELSNRFKILKNGFAPPETIFFNDYRNLPKTNRILEKKGMSMNDYFKSMIKVMNEEESKKNELKEKLLNRMKYSDTEAGQRNYKNLNLRRCTEITEKEK